MRIIVCFRELFGLEEAEYKELIESIKAGLEDGSLDYRIVDMIADIRRTPHWKMWRNSENPVFPIKGSWMEKLFEFIKAGYHPAGKLATSIEKARDYSNSPEGEAVAEAKRQAENRAMDELHPPKPAIRLIKTDQPRISKFDGHPNLPDSVVWPLNPEGVELDFLAQIHCPELPSGLGLPETGTLFVFYDCVEQPWGMDRKDSKYWKLIYTEEPLPSIARERQAPREEFDITPGVFVKFEVFESRFSDTLDDTGHHQMLGYPLWIQDDDMASGKILLLQLDTDEEENGPGWMWGDAGRLFFWIKPGDLAARRFDRAQLVLECY